MNVGRIFFLRSALVTWARHTSTVTSLVLGVDDAVGLVTASSSERTKKIMGGQQNCAALYRFPNRTLSQIRFHTNLVQDRPHERHSTWKLGRSPNVGWKNLHRALLCQKIVEYVDRTII